MDENYRLDFFFIFFKYPLELYLSTQESMDDPISIAIPEFFLITLQNILPWIPEATNQKSTLVL